MTTTQTQATRAPTEADTEAALNQLHEELNARVSAVIRDLASQIIDVVRTFSEKHDVGEYLRYLGVRVHGTDDTGRRVFALELDTTEQVKQEVRDDLVASIGQQLQQDPGKAVLRPLRMIQLQYTEVEEDNDGGADRPAGVDPA